MLKVGGIAFFIGISPFCYAPKLSEAARIDVYRRARLDSKISSEREEWIVFPS